MNRDTWLDKEIEKNTRQIRELERRNRQLARERSTPADPHADLLERLRTAHDAAQETRAPADIYRRALVCHEALDAGFSKYRISQVLNVSRGMVYHYLDPEYQKKLNEKRNQS